MDLSVQTVVLNPTPRANEDDLWKNNELGTATPEKLTLTLTSIVIKHLKIRSSQAHRDLEMSSFEKVKIFHPNNPNQIIDIYRYTSRQASEAAQNLFTGLQNCGNINLSQVAGQLKKIDIMPNLGVWGEFLKILGDIFRLCCLKKYDQKIQKIQPLFLQIIPNVARSKS